MQANSYNSIPNKIASTDEENTQRYSDLQINPIDPLELEDQYQKKEESDRHWGKCYPFLFNSVGDPLIVLGPHLGPLFICAFGVFFVISVFMIGFISRSDASVLTQFMTILVCLSQLLSYLMVALRDPGVANKDQGIKITNKEGKRKAREPWQDNLDAMILFLRGFAQFANAHNYQGQSIARIVRFAYWNQIIIALGLGNAQVREIQKNFMDS